MRKRAEANDAIKNSKVINNTLNAKANELMALAKVKSDELLVQLGSRPTGLSDGEAEQAIDKYGKNLIRSSKKNNVFLRLVHAFASPFNIMMLVVAIVSFVTDWLSGDVDWVTPAIILAIILISGTLRFHEENKSFRSTAKLKELTENTTTVLRDGTPRELPNGSLAVGDVIRLGAGDMMPADVRIIAAKDLFVDQSALTGESNPVEKVVELDPTRTIGGIFDIPNIGFEGSNVVSGTGTALVVNVGGETAMGRLAAKVIEKRGKTAFEKGIDSIARMLMGFMGVMVPMVFLIEGLAHGNSSDFAQWIKAFTYALSIAVGLTPALMPVQVAGDLTKGALNMSKKDVIVKDINSIQNFGAMDVLCTDKTGTLTEGNSTLSEYVGFDDQPNDSVIDYAFLNSKYQTGIRNQLDKSIVEYMDTRPDDEGRLTASYRRLDELPFDFERKMLTILVSTDDPARNLMITKGFPGTVKDKIKYIKEGDVIREATPADIVKIKNTAEGYGSLGARVILVAFKYVDRTSISLADESDMTFLGYITFKDSPKSSAKAALAKLRAYGVHVKVLTGDGLAASMTLCQSTGFGNIKAISGPKIALMDDRQLSKAVEDCDLFVKLSPDDKQRIVKALKANRHVVGFMGDGINDAPALHEADIGISFKDATDIAKEAADIILLENDLGVLYDGIIEGRTSYCNMMKYLKGQSSSNFGNMISQLIGSIWIPFLPMQPVQIILLDIITDISCAVMPFDKVDEEMIRKPCDFSVKQIRDFMFMFAPLSSVIDMATFAFLMYYTVPGMAGGAYGASTTNAALFAMAFQTGFFIESVTTQNFVYAFLRTEKIPLIQSSPSLSYGFSIVLSVLVGFFVIYVPGLQTALGFVSLPGSFIGVMFGFMVVYLLLTQPAKALYKKIYGRLL